MLGIHWFPSVAYPVIVIALIAWALNEFPKWRDRRSREKAVERQLKADEPLRNEFWVKHKVIRDKYDPEHEWNEGTSLPAEYTREMAELNAEYRAVMDRWHNQ
jgi:Ni/Co efflux regulator RcnB